MTYQLTYIVPADAADFKELEQIIIDINAQIAELGGNIKDPISGLIESQFNESFRSDKEVQRIMKEQQADIFKHRLAYPIKHHRYGYYVSIVFTLGDKNNESTIKSVHSKLKANKNILRTLINSYDTAHIEEQVDKKEKFKIKEKNRAKANKAVKKEEAADKPQEKETILAEEPKKTKTKIEDLDEKLEQILNA